MAYGDGYAECCIIQSLKLYNRDSMNLHKCCLSLNLPFQFPSAAASSPYFDLEHAASLN